MPGGGMPGGGPGGAPPAAPLRASTACITIGRLSCEMPIVDSRDIASCGDIGADGMPGGGAPPGGGPPGGGIGGPGGAPPGGGPPGGGPPIGGPACGTAPSCAAIICWRGSIGLSVSGLHYFRHYNIHVRLTALRGVIVASSDQCAVRRGRSEGLNHVGVHLHATRV